MKNLEILTGNYRYRTGLFNKLILQVEYEFSRLCKERGFSDSELKWRDAKVTDLQPFHNKNYKKNLNTTTKCPSREEIADFLEAASSPLCGKFLEYLKYAIEELRRDDEGWSSI